MGDTDVRTIAIAVVALIAIGASQMTALAGSSETLTAECHKQLRLGDKGCACVGTRAQDRLNEKQQRMVVAMVTRDQAASTALRAQMTAEEITGAANFMTDTPRICAAQQSQ